MRERALSSINSALSFIASKSYSKAIQELEKLKAHVAATPVFIEVNKLLGQAAQAGGNLEQRKVVILPIIEKILEHNKAHPNEYEILYALGACYGRIDDYENSLHFYKAAIEAHPDFPEAINNMGYCYYKMAKNQNDLETARRCLHKALEMTPDSQKSLTLTNLCATYVSNHTPDEAITIHKTIERLDPNFKINHNNYAMALLEKGKWDEAWDWYDFREDGRASTGRFEGIPVWNGREGQCLIVFGEQGIGDEIMFGSCLEDAAINNHLIFDCHPRLMEIWRESFPWMNIYGTRKDEDVGWLRNYRPTAKIALASLPKFFRRTRESFPGKPYLRSSRRLMALYREYLFSQSPESSRKFIGISWKGGTPHTHAHYRHIPLENWAPFLSKFKNTVFVSLQYHGDAEAEVEAFKKNHPDIPMLHFSDVMKDYEHTVALVSALDFVVSVPQSVVHAAGALGIQTYQLVPHRSMWQMGPIGENMPWYACVENVWQEKDFEWDEVFERTLDKILTNHLKWF